MNIYITKENERALRDYGGSMSGLINSLLDAHFAATGDPAVRLDSAKAALEAAGLPHGVAPVYKPLEISNHKRSDPSPVFGRPLGDVSNVDLEPRVEPVEPMA